MTPEGKVKEQVKKVLNAYGAYHHWPVQNGMGAPTIDCIGCFRGFYFGVETKAPGGKPTLRQEKTIAAIRASHGKVFVIDGLEALTTLHAWLEDISGDHKRSPTP